jgi:hypothetical protein
MNMLFRITLLKQEILHAKNQLFRSAKKNFIYLWQAV